MIQFTNADRTVLVTIWPGEEHCEVARRGHASEVWGPPDELHPEDAGTRNQLAMLPTD